MRRATVVLTALALGGALAGCSGDKHEAAAQKVKRPAPVRLAVGAGAKATAVKVGVIWSKSGEGSQWRLGASGAEVAAYRYSGLGDADVTVVPAEDGGTASGAARAVGRLVDQGVSGIVVATSGQHVTGALEAAASAGVPVLLPYDTSVTVTSGAWRTGPSDDQVRSGLAAALAASGVHHPAIVVADGRSAPGIPHALSIADNPGDPDAVTRALVSASDRQRIDGVVIWGDADTDARLTTALEGALPGTPLVLSPDASAASFDLGLATSGVLPASLLTVGTDTSDTAALSAGSRGDSASAFFSAVRLAAASDKVRSVSGGPLAEVAAYVDIASHDAVVALVDAVAAARSTDPSAVGRTLAGLQLDAGDGLAGPPLDFSSPDAVADDDVVALQATAQDPGVRPADAAGSGTRTSRVHWFVAPTVG